MKKHEKLVISLRYWLLGQGYLVAAKALEYGLQKHTGLRKDGITPEFQHQIEIALYLRTLVPWMKFPEETIAAALLHDVAEDYDVDFDELRSLFGDRITDAVFRLTKKYKGVAKSTEEYFRGVAECPIASIVKGADRIHNLQSMLGVFNLAKQKSYAEEAKVLFLPMLKQARRQFVEQEALYENIKLMMRSQLELLAAIHAAVQPA